MPEVRDRIVCSECGEEYEVEPSQGNLAIPLPPGLEVPPVCRPCYLKMRERTNQQHAIFEPVTHEEKLLEAMGSLGINVRRHGHLTLHELGTKESMLAQQFVHDVLEAGRWGEVDGLYIWGETGTGKSQLAVSTVRALLTTGTYRQRDIVYDRARSMVTELQDRYTTGRVDEFSRTRRDARLWVYEDAGTEKHTPDAFRVMEDLFDRREGNPTIITSNLSRDDLAGRWREFDSLGRFLSRLQGFVSVRMGGTDRRRREG